MFYVGNAFKYCLFWSYCGILIYLCIPQFRKVFNPHKIKQFDICAPQFGYYDILFLLFLNLSHINSGKLPIKMLIYVI